MSYGYKTPFEPYTKFVERPAEYTLVVIIIVAVSLMDVPAMTRRCRHTNPPATTTHSLPLVFRKEL